MRLPIALLLCVVAAGCGERKAPTTPAERGLLALEGKTDFNGVPLPARAGRSPTIVVVFASWCGPCREELATLSELRQTQPVRILGINAYEEFDNFSNEGKLRKFVSDTAPWLPVVRDDGTLLKVFGGVPKIPTMFIYDASGAVVAEFRRGRRALPTRAELLAALEHARGS